MDWLLLDKKPKKTEPFNYTDSLEATTLRRDFFVLGDWDFSNSPNIQSLFEGATAFNNGGSSSIKNWNVSGRKQDARD